MKPLAAAFLLSVLALPLAPPALAQAPARAQASGPASNAQQQQAARFVSDLSDRAFAVLRDSSLSHDEARARFRALLAASFDIDGTGMRLIRSYRAPGSPTQLTPAQLQAYRAALPGFLVNTYSDRLYDFATAKLTVVRTVPSGQRGNVDVYTRITDPKGGAPINAIWQVTGGATPLVSNLVVNGVNIALTQETDFKSYVDRNGFDALIAFMKKGA